MRVYALSILFMKIRSFFRNRIIIVSIILLISGSIQILWITDPPGSHPASGSVPGSSSFPFCKKIGASLYIRKAPANSFHIQL